ncbi:hypothetical protein L917_19544 [Phytophthora nicotianae]|uniref:Uncharacterized protein n=2 Tax=Phytophthora nicotianae TaxID=4792 RepID=W2K460_PHYNI|nr:hypothetical protein L917_19544 [Phytophthora nicotianae]
MSGLNLKLVLTTTIADLRLVTVMWYNFIVRNHITTSKILMLTEISQKNEIRYLILPE